MPIMPRRLRWSGNWMFAWDDDHSFYRISGMDASVLVSIHLLEPESLLSLTPSPRNSSLILRTLLWQTVFEVKYARCSTMSMLGVKLPLPDAAVSIYKDGDAHGRLPFLRSILNAALALSSCCECATRATQPVPATVGMNAACAGA